MSFIILACITGFLVLVTLIPLWRHDAWWVRGMDFPRFQLFVLGLLILLASIIFLDFDTKWSWVIVGVTLACIGLHLYWIIPYTKIFPVEVKKGKDNGADNRIKIITSNVLMTNHAAHKLLRLVSEYNPDILVVLESDKWWEEKLTILEDEYKYTMKCPLDNKYGMHVYSKLVLEDAAIQFLVEPDIPSMHAMVMLKSGVKVRVHFLHPAPPSPTENESSSERDAELMVVGKSVADEEGPIIVTGDLNDVAWSATTRLFRKISGLLDPRIGRGMFNTFHADHWFARWPLDHVFHSEHFTLKHIARLPHVGSDHFPMFVELIYNVADGADQEGLKADEDDQEWAEEKMDEHGVDEADVHEPGK
jgi:endonuclease/exonuclease/phosphatase (EEP) superfamily protein YafD